MSDFQQALADDVSVHDFFMSWVPKLFESRHDDFKASSDIDFIVCVKFDDADDIYTLEMSKVGIVVEDDEMIDFPVLTVVAAKRQWPQLRALLRPIADGLDSRREQLRAQYHLSEALLEDWEALDLVIDLEVVTSSQPLRLSLVLNDYSAPAGARRFGFSVAESALNDVANGIVAPEDLARSLKITGDVRAAATFGGMLLKHQAK